DRTRIELAAQREQERGVEAGTHLPREDELRAVEVADEQRAETDARALRIGESTDDELLRQFALHFQPVRRAPMFVRRIASFRDDALPAFTTRELPRLGIADGVDAVQGRRERKLPQQRLPGLQRQPRDRTAVNPEQIEDVIAGRTTPPRQLAIENELVVWERG